MIAVGCSAWLDLFVFFIGSLLGCLAVNLVAYVAWEKGKPSIYHVPKFSKYLQLFFVYCLSEFRIKLGLPSKKAELLFEKLLLESVGQGSGQQRANDHTAYSNKEGAHRSNEKEISHGRVPWQNTLNAFAGGAVGFIDWLDRSVVFVNGTQIKPTM